jgi:hypothetical protein
LDYTKEERVELNGAQVDRNKYPTLQRNAAQVKDKARILPKPLIVTVNINGHLARALLDSGSLGDFMSTNLADQLNVNTEWLEVPLTVQLAVQGSRSRSNSRARVRFQYQGIDEERLFDIININSYDLILGTPWLYQHQAYIGLNPGRVVIGSPYPLSWDRVLSFWLKLSLLEKVTVRFLQVLRHRPQIIHLVILTRSLLELK